MTPSRRLEKTIYLIAGSSSEWNASNLKIRNSSLKLWYTNNPKGSLPKKKFDICQTGRGGDQRGFVTNQKNKNLGILKFWPCQV